MATRRFLFRPWLLAARPKTLPGSAVPVVVGSAMAAAANAFEPKAAALCLAFALLSQMGANFINDWSDFRRGADRASRLGPNRMVAEGIISPRAMFVGAMLMFAVASIFGLGLVFYGGWKLIVVGILCALGAILYSAGPFPLSYCALGDVLVVLFFGVVATGYTYSVQTGVWTPEIVLAGLALGFACDNILTANNYRDRDQDRESRKYTLVALFGERFGRFLYLANGLIAVLFFLLVGLRESNLSVTVFLAALWLLIHLQTWRQLCQLHGSALNRILALSAKNLLLLGLFLSALFLPCLRP